MSELAALHDGARPIDPDIERRALISLFGHAVALGGVRTV
jgi:hypothetical protein